MKSSTLWNPAIDDDPGLRPPDHDLARTPAHTRTRGRVLRHQDGESGGVVYGDQRTVEQVVALLGRHGFKEMQG